VSTSTLFLDFDGVLHSMSGLRDAVRSGYQLLAELTSMVDILKE
jgi:hypothetical protein